MRRTQQGNYCFVKHLHLCKYEYIWSKSKIYIRIYFFTVGHYQKG